MQKADIVIVGSGVAGTATLMDVFRKLIDGAAREKLTITIIEKHHEFWLGIPYGSRSSVNALTITSISDFFTDEKQRSLFFGWFKLNRKKLLEDYLLKGGLTAKQWLQSNYKAIDSEDWKNVYLPRHMFGKYQREVFDELLATVKERGLAEVNLINSEAFDIKPAKDGTYELIYAKEGKGKQVLSAKKVVIATGSAPVKDIAHSFKNRGQVIFINDIYYPRVDDNIKVLVKALASAKNADDRNVLIIGSNASSIELLYLLAGMPDVLNLVNKLVVISKSGLLPYHLSNEKLESYPCKNLDRLKTEGNYTIETLVDAAMKDIKAAINDTVIVPHIDKIITYTFELLQPLDEDAKKAFIGIYGMQLSNLFRRSGTDYKKGAGLLLEIQKLILLKGAFLSIEPGNNAGILNYIDPDTGVSKKYDTLFKAVINCTGSNDLDQSSSRLLYNMVHSRLAGVNLSGKGFYVNERFEAAPNLYIMGPLLGGNKNERIHFWHLENASRLLYLAPFLAEILLEPWTDSTLTQVSRNTCSSKANTIFLFLRRTY